MGSAFILHSHLKAQMCVNGCGVQCIEVQMEDEEV